MRKYYLLSTYLFHFLVTLFSCCTQMINLDVTSKVVCEKLSVHHFLKGLLHQQILNGNWL